MIFGYNISKMYIIIIDVLRDPAPSSVGAR